MTEDDICLDELDLNITGKESDEELQDIAKKLLPQQLKHIGTIVAEGAWADLCKAVSAFSTPTKGEKREFIKETVAEFTDGCDDEEREEVIQLTVAKLKSLS